MATTGQPPIAVYRVHPATPWVTVFVAFLLQRYLPLKISLARLFDFPLLITIYFALLWRNKIFGIVLGTVLGMIQDALSGDPIGISGMAKAVAGYLAASSSVKFDLEQFAARTVLTAAFVVVHNACLWILRHSLLEAPPPFQLLDQVSSVLVNVALGLIIFPILDRFKRPA